MSRDDRSSGPLWIIAACAFWVACIQTIAMVQSEVAAHRLRRAMEEAQREAAKDLEAVRRQLKDLGG